MIISLLKILISLVFISDDTQEINIKKYLLEKLVNFNRIEYIIESPQNVNLSSYKIDTTRELKIKRDFAYLPVKYINNEGTKNSLITLKLKLYKNVLVANRSIRKKEFLAPEDFRLVEKEISRLRFDAIDPSLPISLFRSKLKISENLVLQSSMIEKIPEIEAGDRIEAIFNNNSVNISFRVTARGEGVSGDVIKVKRDDKRIFSAKIINNSTVKIIE